MKTCELCGAENPEGKAECARCGFVFRMEIRADVRDNAILERHAGKSVEEVNRDLKNARAKLAAYLENISARTLSKEELATLLDDALAFLRIPLKMGVEDELRFDEHETGFIGLVAENLERADLEEGGPTGTPGTYTRLSNALQALDRPDQAMAMIEKALLLNPRDRDAIFTRSKLLFYAKRYSLARKGLEKLAADGGHEKASYLIELIDQISSD